MIMLHCSADNECMAVYEGKEVVEFKGIVVLVLYEPAKVTACGEGAVQCTALTMIPK